MAKRVLFFSDTHLGFDYPVRSKRSAPHRRGEQFFKNFETALAHGVEHCDLIIHGGDFFHRSRPHPSVVDRAYLTLVEAASAGVPIIIVPGNHERSVLPPSLWLSHRFLTVFGQPQSIAMDLDGVVVEITGVPHLNDVRGQMARTLAELPRVHEAQHRLCVIHQAVDGSTVGPGDFTFFNRPDTVARHELDQNFDLVLSGHIHRHQLLPGRPPVLHCGSTERTSRAEVAEQKGYAVIELESAADPSITFHALPMTELPEPWRDRAAAVAAAGALDYDDAHLAQTR